MNKNEKKQLRAEVNKEVLDDIIMPFIAAIIGLITAIVTIVYFIIDDIGERTPMPDIIGICIMITFLVGFSVICYGIIALRRHMRRVKKMETFSDLPIDHVRRIIDLPKPDDADPDTEAEVTGSPIAQS
jgi:hypothetical protein